MKSLSTLKETNDVINEIEQAFFTIPFENSDYQNEVFVLAAQITPERAYRALGLRMNAKLRALRENYFNEQKREINLGELREKLESESVSKWDKMRAQVEIDEIESSISYTEKLKADAIAELNCLYKHFKALPRFTREQFENAERNHFEEKLGRNVKGINGALESYINLDKDIPALLSYESAFKDSNSEITLEQLEALRLAMSNQSRNNTSLQIK